MEWETYIHVSTLIHVLFAIVREEMEMAFEAEEAQYQRDRAIGEQQAAEQVQREAAPAAGKFSRSVTGQRQQKTQVLGGTRGSPTRRTHRPPRTGFQYRRGRQRLVTAGNYFTNLSLCPDIQWVRATLESVSDRRTSCVFEWIVGWRAAKYIYVQKECEWSEGRKLEPSRTRKREIEGVGWGRVRKKWGKWKISLFFTCFILIVAS